MTARPSRSPRGDVVAIWTNTGRGNTDGVTVTPVLSGAGDDNPFGVVAGTWRFEADNLSPDGPTGGLGYQATVTESGTTVYLRGDDPTPTGNRGGVRFWYKVPTAAPAADKEIVRIVDSADATVGGIQLRTTGVIRVLNVSSGVAASQTTTPAPGWYCFELIFDADNGTIDFRIQNAAGTTVHSWNGTDQTITRIPARYRVGLQGGSDPGAAWDVLEVGSMVRWGSLASGWIGPGLPVDPDPIDPAPPTGKVTHWNSAEGRTVDTGPRLGGIEDVQSDGMGFDAILGTGGNLRAVSTNVAHGTRGWRINSAADTSAYVQWTVSTRKLAARMYLYLPAAPGATQRIMDFRAADLRPGTIYLSPTGRVGLQGLGGSSDIAGVPALPAVLRLEMVEDLDAGTVWGAWAYGDGGYEGELSFTGTSEAETLTAVHFGKTHSTTWDATSAVMDDLAVNAVVAEPISKYAATYEIQATTAADLHSVEPGAPFTLTGFGDETWAQVVKPGHPTVPVTQVGGSATGTAPFTLSGVTLEFDFGGATQKVGVMRATRRIKTGGVMVPVERRVKFS